MDFDLNQKSFIEKLLHTPVKSFEISEGCKKGDNVAGSLRSIKAIAESGKAISAVYKFFPPKDSPIYNEVKDGGVFRAESKAYSVMIKELEEFVNSRKAPNENGTGPCPYIVPMPKLFDHFNDDENDYICLEDVRPQGFAMPIVFDGLSYPATFLILQELARFHAYTYAYIRFHGEQLFIPATGKFSALTFAKWRTEAKVREWHSMVSACIQNATEIIEGINPPLAKVMKEKIPAKSSGSFVDSIHPLTDTKVFPCLVHGDFWSNNILLKYEPSDNISDNENTPTVTEGKTPIDVRFVDFQFTRRGNIFEDLLYFIFTSTDTEFRKKYLTRALADYYMAFKSALTSIKFLMPINFTPGFLIDSFMSLAKPMMIHMYFAIPLQMGKQWDAEEMQEEINQDVKNGNSHTNEVSNNTGSGVELFSNAFVLSLKQMILNSPPALKRLEEITEEVLNSGIFFN